MKTKMKIILLTFSLICVLPFSAIGQNDVRKFGAKGDGVTLDTKSIQSAVDQCAVNGEGQVYFPAGKYLSRTIYLKSNVVLFLEAGYVNQKHY